MQKSPLAPVTMPQAMEVAGVRWASLAAELRYRGRDDLALIVFAAGTTIGAVFTQSSTAGHPIQWNRRHIGAGCVRAILVNAGNANVFRGAEGDENVERSAKSVADLLGCDSSEVFIGSTGVIGERLPVEKLCSALPRLVDQLQSNQMIAVSAAIMTTDTFAKFASIETEIKGKPVKISGIAKGSGMIAPDMATMLAFVVTDAAIEHEALQQLIKSGADRSFNAITVDSDTSTSDTLMLCATGHAGHDRIEHIDDPSLNAFRMALDRLLLDLAMMVVRDGEGAQKLISIAVKGALDDLSARTIGRAVANSPLVKTAIAGEDANWGRVIMAIGKSGEPIELNQLAISFGGNAVARNGSAIAERDEGLVDQHLKGREIDIDIKVGNGPGQATVWTCDLTHAYIDINADYRS